MNNYIVRSYRDVIVITKFAITKFATRRASKAQTSLTQDTGKAIWVQAYQQTIRPKARVWGQSAVMVDTS